MKDLEIEYPIEYPFPIIGKDLSLEITGYLDSDEEAELEVFGEFNNAKYYIDSDSADAIVKHLVSLFNLDWEAVTEKGGEKDGV